MEDETGMEKYRGRLDPFVNGKLSQWTSEEREEFEKAKSAIESVLYEYRRLRFYAGSEEEKQKWVEESRKYQEEFNRLVFMSPEERKKILEEYPSVASRLEREGG